MHEPVVECAQESIDLAHRISVSDIRSPRGGSVAMSPEYRPAKESLEITWRSEWPAQA